MTNIPCPFHPFLSWFWKHCVDVLTSWNQEKCFSFLTTPTSYTDMMCLTKAVQNGEIK